MIAWDALLFNALWIAGAAVLLAHLSYRFYLRSTPAGVQPPPGSAAVPLAIILISIGLIGNSRTVWERVLLILIVVALGANTLWLSRKHKT